MIAHREIVERRGARKVRSRESLVRATRDLVRKQGFVGLKTADVARAAGLSHGALFVHFPTRDALIQEAIRRLTEALTDRLASLIGEGHDLRQVLEAHLACLAEHEELYRRLLIEMPMLPEAVGLTWLGFQSAVSHHVAQAVHEERSRGALRPMAPHLLFNTWIGLVHHYCLNRDLFAPGQSVFERRGAMLVGHFMTLIAP